MHEKLLAMWLGVCCISVTEESSVAQFSFSTLTEPVSMSSDIE